MWVNWAMSQSETRRRLSWWPSGFRGPIKSLAAARMTATRRPPWVRRSRTSWPKRSTPSTPRWVWPRASSQRRELSCCMFHFFSCKAAVAEVSSLLGVCPGAEGAAATAPAGRGRAGRLAGLLLRQAATSRRCKLPARPQITSWSSPPPFLIFLSIATFKSQPRTCCVHSHTSLFASLLKKKI